MRTCLAMSCLTQQPLRLDGVRSRTKFPGLDYEDLVLMRALGKSCEAEMLGAEVGTTSISFLPTRRPIGLNGSLDLPDDEALRRGASAPVVLNALLPVLARTGMYSNVSMSGETYGSRSLSFDYFQGVTIPALQRFGLYAFPDQERAGFGRESRGSVTMDVEPSQLKGVNWSDRGRLISVKAIVTTAELPVTVAERATAHLEKMAQHSKISLEIETNPVDSRSAGAFVSVWGQFERGMGGATAMGSRGVRMETLTHTAFEGMLEFVRGGEKHRAVETKEDDARRDGFAAK